MGIELPIDHVAFGTTDLEQAVEIVAGSGLSMTPMGEVQWPGEDGTFRARTVSVVVTDGYLDIIEYDGAHGHLAPTGLVLRAPDLAATRAELMHAGVRCGRLYAIVRRFFGAGADQRYTIFGTNSRHPCGLLQSVITTEPRSPMQNVADHTCGVVSLEDGARRLGVELQC